MISDMLKKGILSSIGMAVIAKDTVEEMGKKIVGKGGMSEEEGRKFFDELARFSEKARGEIESRVQEMIRDALAKMDIASRTEVQTLRERVAQLERERAEREVHRGEPPLDVGEGSDPHFAPTSVAEPGGDANAVDDEVR